MILYRNPLRWSTHSSMISSTIPNQKRMSCSKHLVSYKLVNIWMIQLSIPQRSHHHPRSKESAQGRKALGILRHPSLALRSDRKETRKTGSLSMILCLKLIHMYGKSRQGGEATAKMKTAHPMTNIVKRVESRAMKTTQRESICKPF